MKKWLVQAQVFYPKAAQTIRNHLEGICNYFISRTTSGVMEGINNKAKLIMRQGFSSYVQITGLKVPSVRGKNFN